MIALDRQQWSSLPPLPTARGAPAAIAVDNKIFVNGGASIPAGMRLPDGLAGAVRWNNAGGAGALSAVVNVNDIFEP